MWITRCGNGLWTEKLLCLGAGLVRQKVVSGIVHRPGWRWPTYPVSHVCFHLPFDRVCSPVHRQKIKRHSFTLLPRCPFWCRSSNHHYQYRPSISIYWLCNGIVTPCSPIRSIITAWRRPMVQYYCAGVSGISQAQEVYRQTMSGVDMVSDPFGSYDTLDLDLMTP